MDDDRTIEIKCGDRRVIGIYGKGDDNVRQYARWVDKVFQLLRYPDGLAIRD